MEPMYDATQESPEPRRRGCPHASEAESVCESCYHADMDMMEPRPVAPRDCDGQLVTRCKVCGADCESDPPRCVRCATVQYGSASGVNLDERWTTTDAETDNAAMIARDLEAIKERVRQLKVYHGPMGYLKQTCLEALREATELLERL